jgi:hypothetical protein
VYTIIRCVFKKITKIRQKGEKMKKTLVFLLFFIVFTINIFASDDKNTSGFKNIRFEKPEMYNLDDQDMIIYYIKFSKKLGVPDLSNFYENIVKKDYISISNTNHITTVNYVLSANMTFYPIYDFGYTNQGIFVQGNAEFIWRIIKNFKIILPNIKIYVPVIVGNHEFGFMISLKIRYLI